MAKTQTRRTVSIPGALYERFRALCEERGVSMAGIATELIDEWCGEEEAMAEWRPLRDIPPDKRTPEQVERLAVLARRVLVHPPGTVEDRLSRIEALLEAGQ